MSTAAIARIAERMRGRHEGVLLAGGCHDPQIQRRYAFKFDAHRWPLKFGAVH
jgi:hypothetical protein